MKAVSEKKHGHFTTLITGYTMYKAVLINLSEYTRSYQR